MLDAGLTSNKHVFVGNKNGDVKKALKVAVKTVEATYAYPYQAHATMEPMNATARWTKDRCEVWCPTQNGEAALEVAAEAANLPPNPIIGWRFPALTAAAKHIWPRSPSPSNCRGHRSSYCGRAKKTRRMTSTIRSPNANWSVGWMSWAT